MALHTTTEADATVLRGRAWHVDPTASTLSFDVKTAWGMQTVRGTFGRFEGTLTVAADGVATGELTIQAATLDTGHRKRDEHLRSEDFFGVERHPVVRFTPHTVSTRADGLTLTGDLRIKDSVLAFELPVEVVASAPDQVRLKTAVDVQRDATGMTWNRMGMIRGDAHLHADVTLVR
jgi:polyisoprenoid-binding protein YceI